MRRRSLTLQFTFLDPFWAGRVESGSGIRAELEGFPFVFRITFSFIDWTAPAFQCARPGAQAGHRALILPEGTLGLAPPQPCES